MNKLAGFKSLCTIPLYAMYKNPAITSRKYGIS